ncbi:hypothetical protein [Vibrio celticus]|uniref:Uncharacterized protein n=1 Tax=Vibrio celticus TaxID=446372 RepID=A0A1C3JIV5_9VIBR|nr:hypothetical protein [Vibrio celticus]SBT15143.1 hypothetical protein VCE7224_03930 [Vibrio celticus]
MVTTVSVEKLKIQAAIYPNDEIARYLNHLTAHPHALDPLLACISPIKVVKYKRKLYPVEYLDEILWLRSHYPETKIASITVEAVKSIAEVDQHIYTRLILKHLPSINNKDLYGLEQKWKEQINSGYSPLLSQKQWAQLINCERSSLHRHRKQLTTSLETSSKEHTESKTFTWENATRQIPSNDAIE